MPHEAARPGRGLELKQRAQRPKLHSIHVIDLEALVFGAHADFPDAKADAGAPETVGAGALRAHAADGALGVPPQPARLAEEVDRPERKDEQAGEARAAQLEARLLCADVLRGLAELGVRALDREVDERDHVEAPADESFPGSVVGIERAAVDALLDAGGAEIGRA